MGQFTRHPYFTISSNMPISICVRGYTSNEYIMKCINKGNYVHSSLLHYAPSSIHFSQEKAVVKTIKIFEMLSIDCPVRVT